LKLTQQAGEVDSRKVISRLTKDQFYEWWAFGYLESWFPQEEKQSKGMTPNEVLKALGG